MSLYFNFLKSSVLAAELVTLRKATTKPSGKVQSQILARLNKEALHNYEHYSSDTFNVAIRSKLRWQEWLITLLSMCCH